MRKSKRHEYRQSYNAQAVVDADGSQLVLTANVAQTPSDAPTFEETINTLCETLGQPATILADAGFAKDEAVGALEARGIEVLVAVSRADQHRVYDFRPPKPGATPPPEPKAEWRKAMKRKMATEDPRAVFVTFSGNHMVSRVVRSRCREVEAFAVLEVADDLEQAAGLGDS